MDNTGQFDLRLLLNMESAFRCNTCLRTGPPDQAQRGSYDTERVTRGGFHILCTWRTATMEELLEGKAQEKAYEEETTESLSKSTQL